MRIVFIGPPGAGKGTQAERMIETYRLAHLSTGDMLRAARDARTAVGVEAERFMSTGQLVPDDIIVAIIRDRLEQPDCRAGYLLDGFPRTIAQAEALDAMLEKRGTPLDAVLQLDVPEEELFRRLAGRGPGRRQAGGHSAAAGCLSSANGTLVGLLPARGIAPAN